MTDFDMINYIVSRGWQPVEHDLFVLPGRTGNPVDVPLAYVIQRHLERVHEKITLKQKETQTA